MVEGQSDGGGGGGAGWCGFEECQCGEELFCGVEEVEAEDFGGGGECAAASWGWGGEGGGEGGADDEVGADDAVDECEGVEEGGCQGGGCGAESALYDGAGEAVRCGAGAW